MNKDKSEQQSQQGIVEFEKEFEHLYASVPGSHYWYISARNFVQQRLKEQAQHTRKETLEEAIDLINNDRSLYHPGQCVMKLIDLLNKQ